MLVKPKPGETWCLRKGTRRVVIDSVLAGTVFAHDPDTNRRTSLRLDTLIARYMPDVPANFPVQPLKPSEPATRRTTCNTCGRSWDDGKATSMTPAPAARCPFEAFHPRSSGG